PLLFDPVSYSQLDTLFSKLKMARIMIAAGLVALLVPVYAGIIPRHLPSGLDTNDIPPACVDTCQSLVNSVQQGCVDDVTCFCSATFVTSLRPCVQCSYDAVPSPFDGTPDQYIQQYSSTCAAAGLPVDGGAASSGSASATGSATASGGTSTSASGSQTATASASTGTTPGTGTASKPASSGASLSNGTTSKSTATTSASGSSGTSGSGSASGSSTSGSSQSGATSITQNMFSILTAVSIIASLL
ncbi:hypothetical protein CPB83DRAFT_863001, partial [Crepidotus variabilis]